MTPGLRLARHDDVPRLVELMTEFYAEAGFPLPDSASAAFTAIITDDRFGHVWVIQDGDEAVGYAVLTLGFSMEYGGLDAFMDDLFIRPSHRDKGLGGSVVEELKRACVARGVRALHLEVDRANDAAHRVYRRAGFKENGRQLLTLRLVVALCLAVLTAVTGCADPTAPLPRDGPPDELNFSYGGWMMDIVTVELQGTSVAMWRRPADWHPGVAIDTVRAVPTDEAWRTFWIAADRAGLRRWRSSYSAEVLDGAGWTLRLVAGDFSLESAGSNAYPDWRGREHELQMTEEFLSFMGALGNLVGAEVGP